VAVLPVPSQIRPIDAAVQRRSSLTSAARFIHNDRKHWVTVAELVPSATWQRILFDAMHLDAG